jgi:hypothetical protein
VVGTCDPTLEAAVDAHPSENVADGLVDADEHAEVLAVLHQLLHRKHQPVTIAAPAGGEVQEHSHTPHTTATATLAVRTQNQSCKMMDDEPGLSIEEGVDEGLDHIG